MSNWNDLITKRIKQRVAARESGVSEHRLSDILRGRSPPKPEEIELLAHWAGLSTDAICQYFEDRLRDRMREVRAEADAESAT